jgi:hypothetical protein
MIIDITKHDGRSEIYNEGELAAKLSRAMQLGDDISLRTIEGNSFTENGIYKLLDTLCEFWNFDKKKITLETLNWYEQHDIYTVKSAKYSDDFTYFSKEQSAKSWDRSQMFGMFIGIARRERIYSLIRYQKSPYKDLGLTSFTQDFMDIDLNSDIAKVCQYADCKINDVVSIPPYSDIDKLRKPPIWHDHNTTGPVWESVYERIAIEVVCETTIHPDAFHITEKTLRPMYYRRPFLAIGSKDYLKKLRSIGFKTFDNIIPSDYDQLEEFVRVDAVFHLLENMISNGELDTLLERCQDDIEHNYNLLLKLSNEHLQTEKNNPGYHLNDNQK